LIIGVVFEQLVTLRVSVTVGLAPRPCIQVPGRKTSDPALAQIDELLKHHTDAQTVAILNERGLKTGAGDRFSSESLRWLRHARGLKSYKEHLREAGMLTTQEIAAHLGICEHTVKRWHKKGQLQGFTCNDKGDWLYYPPVEDTPVKYSRKNNRFVSPAGTKLPEQLQEV